MMIQVIVTSAPEVAGGDAGGELAPAAIATVPTTVIRTTFIPAANDLMLFLITTWTPCVLSFIAATQL